MRTVVKAQMNPAPRNVKRNPVTCVLMTASLAVGFWLGMVWLAERLMG